MHLRSDAVLSSPKTPLDYAHITDSCMLRVTEHKAIILFENNLVHVLNKVLFQNGVADCDVFC